MCFNPLDRGNLYLIGLKTVTRNTVTIKSKFQSPRSGKFVSDQKLNRLNIHSLIAFQSPRSGKFVSNKEISLIDAAKLKGFNPLDRGNIYIGSFYITRDAAFGQIEFQSPRSGKFVSDMMQKLVIISTLNQCFNPLDRGNLYLIVRYSFRDFS